MTLQDTLLYMVQHPFTKFTCTQFSDNEWIMFDGSNFIFEDGYNPDSFWWIQAESWECVWWKKRN